MKFTKMIIRVNSEIFVKYPKFTLWFMFHMIWYLPDVSGQHFPCPALVPFLSGFPENRVRSAVRILSVSILSAVRILSGIFEKKTLFVVCLSGQRRDRAVRTFRVLVRRRLVLTWPFLWWTFNLVFFVMSFCVFKLVKKGNVGIYTIISNFYEYSHRIPCSDTLGKFLEY